MLKPPPPLTAKALYGYQPSLAVAVVGAVIFTGIATYTCYQYVRNRTWFLYMLIVGVLCKQLSPVIFSRLTRAPPVETASIISRVISIADPSNVWAFLIAYLVPM